MKATLSAETVMALIAKINVLCKGDSARSVRMITKLESANFYAFQRKQETLSKIEVPEGLNTGIQPVVENNEETEVGILDLAA